MRAREEVLAAVAHDLRTPLTVLAGATAVLAATPELAPHASILARMRRSADSMGVLISDMLEFAAPGDKPLRRPLPTAPQTLVDEAVAMLAPLVRRHGIELTGQTEDGLPDVRVDYESILRVFSNLIGNALKVSVKDTRILVGATSAGADGVAFTVADSGCGMSPEDIEHIFDRFWQKDRQDHRGVGLGLSIVQSLVRAHGGRITVESVEGVGSRFTFTLPAARDSEE